MTDTKLIKKYKAKHGTFWFLDDHQYNAMVIKRFDGQIYSYDMLDVPSSQTVLTVANKKSVMPVQEASTESHEIFKLIG